MPLSAEAPPQVRQDVMRAAPDQALTVRSCSGRRLATLFLAALAVRWIYVGVTVAIAGFDGLKIGDSYGYLETSKAFAKAIAAGQVSGWDWLSGPDLSRMPLFTLSITAHAGLAGAWAPLTFTLVQGVMDAATCLFVYGITRAFDPRFALPAGYAAALTPTLIVVCTEKVIRFDSVTNRDSVGGDDRADPPVLGSSGRAIPVQVGA